MHIELRVQTVCELALHQEYYLQPQIVSVLRDGDQSNLLKDIGPATSGYYTKACNETIDAPENIYVACFQGDCIETTQLNAWSGIWHIYYCLASVLKHPIQSIYPEKNLRIRPAYHKVVLSREEQITVHRPFSIMWTQVATMPENRPSSPRCPNTVPCVPAKSTVLPTVPMT